MAARRFLSDTFWSDPFIEECSPEEKLMFIYLFTNPSVNQCGFYQLSVPTMALHTGVDREEVQAFLTRLRELGKAVYDKGMMFVPTMAKHQKALGDHFEQHVRKIAQLHSSNGNMAYSAFIQQFSRALEGASNPLPLPSGIGQGIGIGLEQE